MAKVNNDQENQRGSLRIESFLPLWFQVITEEDVKRVRSQISDYAVQRHVLDHDDEGDVPEDGDLRLVFNRLNKFQKSIRYYLEQIRSVEKHPYQTRGLTLSSTGCFFPGLEQSLLSNVGEWVEVHLLLPTHPMDIFILGKVVKPATIAFDAMTVDQEDWIIEYLIHRQQEDLRLKAKMRRNG